MNLWKRFPIEVSFQIRKIKLLDKPQLGAKGSESVGVQDGRLGGGAESSLYWKGFPLGQDRRGI